MIDGARIAMLCHSTNPRGGVAHALALGDALHDTGHDVTVVAPAADGQGFPRPARCRAIAFPAARVDGGLADLVRVRSAEYRSFLENHADDFDLLHAHDALSGSVVADLRSAGLAAPFLRTVHHLDDFADAGLAARQARSVTAADAIVCVSRSTAADVRDRYGLAATVIGNGVDPGRFTPAPGPRDAAWRRRFGSIGPVFLAVGGIEARKNTVRVLEAFAVVHRARPSARLVIVGGASLLDHTSTRRAFDAALHAAGPALAAAVDVVGVVDDADMPALYRAADVLAFPSLHEGFGLAVLEAAACGTPVVASRVAPFTEYLGAADVAFCDPTIASSIATAMFDAADPAAAAEYRRRGKVIAARHGWEAAAKSASEIYSRLLHGALSCPK